MSPERFQRERLANQSIVSKACRHGVWMSDERTEPPELLPRQLPRALARDQSAPGQQLGEHAPARRTRRRKFLGYDKMLGFTAQQTVENGLKSLLSLHQDTVEFRHDLKGIWNHYLNNHHDQSRKDHQEIRDVVDELMEHTSYDNPQRPGDKESWLTLYAAVYRYGQETRRMPEWERQELLERIRATFTTVMDHVIRESGTGEEDIFPDGKPWDRTQ